MWNVLLRGQHYKSVVKLLVVLTSANYYFGHISEWWLSCFFLLLSSSQFLKVSNCFYSDWLTYQGWMLMKWCGDILKKIFIENEKYYCSTVYCWLRQNFWFYYASQFSDSNKSNVLFYYAVEMMTIDVIS